MTKPVGYDWDDNVNERCEAQYNFTLSDVAAIFNDERYDYLDLGVHNHEGEARRVAIGRMEWGLIVAVIYTMRDGLRRLIWVRPARRAERAAFNEHNGIEQ